MKTLGIKLALSAVAVAALAASPAFAKTTHRVLSDSASAGYVTVAPGSDIPGYDSQGNVVGIANPDWYSAQSQR
jgi:hypothetical protein